MKAQLWLSAVLLFSTFAFGKHGKLESTSHLEIEVSSKFEVPVLGDETPSIEGHFCVRKEKANEKCRALTPDDLSKYDVKFYYPNAASEVTDKVSVQHSEHKHEFVFEVPQITSLIAPVFLIRVSQKGSRVPGLEKALTKIFHLKSKLLAKKSHWPKGGHGEIQKLMEVLSKVEERIREKLKSDVSLLGKREFPVQLENTVALPSRWTTVDASWKHEVEASLGVSFTGEKTWLSVRSEFQVGNADDNWRFEYFLDGNLLNVRESAPEIIEEKFLSPVLTEGIHTFSLRVLKAKDSKGQDKGKGKGPKKEWEQVFDKDYVFFTLRDEIAPALRETVALPLRQVAQAPSDINFTVEDGRGRLDRSTLSLVLEEPDGNFKEILSTFSISAVGEALNPVFHGDQNGAATYDIRGQPPVLVEGEHRLLFTGRDFAGNAVSGPAWTLVIDRTAPLIMLPGGSSVATNQENFAIPVSVTDSTGITVKVIVNGLPQSEINVPGGSYTNDVVVSLVEGLNLIKVEATDEAGNMSRVDFPPVFLDSTPPALSSLNLAANQTIYAPSFPLQGSANEPLSSVRVNGAILDLSGAPTTSFTHLLEHLVEGEQLLELVLTDMVGNSQSYTLSYQFTLKLLNANLVSVVLSEEGVKYKVVGFPGATLPGISVEVDGGIFNTAETTAKEDGSFEVDLDRFSSAKITVSDTATGRMESTFVSYEVDTTFAGKVLDVYDNPLPGVTVTILSTGQSAITDASGAFAIADPALGDQEVRINGGSVPSSITQGQKSYPTISINVTLGLLQRNILERPIYLAPKMLDGTETVITSGSSAIVSSPHAPGVEIDIPANAAIFPDGTLSGSINILEIPSDKTSVELLEEAQPDTVYALEPSGLKFNQRVKLTLPNVNEFPEGTELVILSKNSLTGNWEPNGSATVVNDIIETKPDQGITHFSEVFATPLGMELKALRKGDRPSVDNSSGAVSTAVSLPGIKSLGSNVTPALIYNSRWASPSVEISNVFDLPRKEYKVSDGVTAGNAFGSVKANLTIKSWINPEFIDVRFYANDLESRRLRFKGIPKKSIVSYQMNLENLPSGIHPVKSNYDIRFRQLTIRTLKTKKKNIWGKTKTKTKTWREDKILKEIFPQELITTIYHQNKANSEAGAGWRLNFGKKIINPNQDRLMLEHESGEVSAYTLNNTIETALYDSKGFNSFTVDGNELFALNKDGFMLDGAENNLGGIGNYTGRLAVNYSWVVGTPGDDRLHNCKKYRAGYNIPKEVTGLLRLGGELYYQVDQGTIFRFMNNEVVVGKVAAPERIKQGFDQTSEPLTYYQNWCKARLDGKTCGPDVHSVQSYIIRHNASRGPVDINWCNDTSLCYSGTCTSSFHQSSGFYPLRGYQGGAGFSSIMFNKVKAMVPGPSAGTLLVSDYGNNQVRIVNFNTGRVDPFAGNQQTIDKGDTGLATSAGIYHPRGIAVHSDGSVYISSENGYIRKVSTNKRIYTPIGKPLAKGGILTDIAGMEEVALNSPSGLVIDHANNYLYVADTGHHRILRIDLDTEEARVVAGNGTCVSGDTLDGKAALDVSLCRPEQIALDGDGNLLVLDEANNRIRRIRFNSGEEGKSFFQPMANDNSLLIREADGTFKLTTRSGSTTTFSASGLELETLDRVGRRTTYEYDEDGRLLVARLPTGQEFTIQYSGNHISSITDPAGKSTLLNFSGDFLSSVRFPDDTYHSFTYNNNGVLTRETNQRGLSINYQLNRWQRLTKIVRPDNTFITMDDAVSQTIANDNDPDFPTLLRSYGNDLESLQDTIQDAKGNVTKFIKDTNGYVQEIIDAQGKVTQVERDNEGRPTKIIRPDLTYTEFTYDPATGDLLKRFESDTGLDEIYSYNHFGQLLSYKDPLNSVRSNIYDAITGLLLKSTDPNGNFTSYTYGNLGVVLTTSNALNLTTTYGYDDFGNLITASAPMGESTSYVRDLAGNVVSKTNAKGQTTTYTYDMFNRLGSVTTPGNFTTSYSYLPTGELATITNPEGHLTLFEYDSIGRLRKKTSPRGQVTQLSYDENSNLVREVTPRGEVKTFGYDELDRLVSKTLPDDLYLYSYNDRGNLISARNKSSSIDFSYISIQGEELLDTVSTSALDLPNYVVTYGYNAVGKRITMESDFISLGYTFDSAYRLTGVTNSLGQSFGFGYDLANRLTSITRNNSVTSTLLFDANSFLQELVHKKGSSVIEGFAYARDQIGNRTSMTTLRGVHSYDYDSENQLISATHPEADALHQLETFTYDSLGNRTSDNQGSYSYDNKRHRLEEDYRYLYVFDLNGNLTSKQEKGLSGKVWTYSYSSENQLVLAEEFEGTVKLKRVEYFYDAFGRRIKKSVQDLQNSRSFERKYAYDSSEIIAELDEDNNVLARHTHSGLRTDDVLTSEITSTGVSAGLAESAGSYLYLKDGLGSVMAVTTTDGDLVQRYVYSSFGKLLKTVDGAGLEATSFKTAYTYTNRELDEETGLYYYRARYYDPNSGRFLTEDPHPGKLTSPISHINKYIYTSNSPVNLVDPSGLFNIGRELGSFFGGSGGWTGDLLTAAVVVGVIVASGGTLGPAILAVAATAGGAALASGGMAAFQKGNFWDNFSNNFHTNFRISATFLALGAIFAPGGVAKAGANTWYQGSIQSSGGSGGMTIGSSSVYTAGSGLGAHEAMHTIQFAAAMTTVSAANRYGNMGLSHQDELRQGWYLYGAAGLVGIPGLGNDGGVFPIP